VAGEHASPAGTHTAAHGRASGEADPGDGPLRATDLDPDPLEQFTCWLADATGAGVYLPEAMTLATSSAAGVPSARVVLLRGFDDRGFTWYTNRDSAKGTELAENPRAALVFHWNALHRQVRISGDVETVATHESEAYFVGRPRGSQLSAWASPQSQVLRSREDLEAKAAELEARFPDEVPLPPFWGGYRVVPQTYEFWAGRRDRMHDRFRYRRGDNGDGWTIERLAP
jgi:pyridoxamine 5'-phosphate oxidase